MEASPHVERWLWFNRRSSQIYGSEIPRDVGQFSQCDIYNVDQTPLPVEFLDGGVKSMRFGWSKRQATQMVTVCADGIRRCNPLIIYRGKGVGPTVIAERVHYHPHVRVDVFDCGKEKALVLISNLTVIL